jgi:asparagine synthase (glutamine-hydrolysing)
MCGIAGYFGTKSINIKKIKSTLRLMRERGPDARESYFKKIEKKNLYFLHSRLSVIDLKKRSNQPYHFKNYLMVFNGEIYNFSHLKNYLIKKGYYFSTTSDTEVLIKMYDHLGEKAFDKLNGMWAIAIFDLKKKKLILSRDRFGEKPLYFKTTKDGIYFGSETKFIQSLFDKKLSPNLEKCNDFLKYGYNSFGFGNSSFIKSIIPLEPSTNLLLKKNKLYFKKYWSLNNIKVNKTLNITKIIKDIRKILINSIKHKLNSDVKDGFFLSGGIDSGTIVSISNKISKKKINSFSIYQNRIKDHDESKIISKISKKLNYNHFSLDVEKIKIIPTLKKMIKYYNSPILTLNNLMHSCLYELMKKENIKVAFSGTGGDEIFAGYYDHYQYHLADLKNTKYYSENYIAWQKNVKAFIRNPKLKTLNKKNIKNFSRFKFIKNFNFLFKKNNTNSFFEKYKKIQNSFLKTALYSQLKENIEPMLYVDDLNAMKYSIENRSPLLDRKLIEKLFSINSRFFIKNGYNKYLMRQATKGILDNNIRLSRRKVGFNCSINSINKMGFKYMKKYILNNKKYINKFFKKNELIKYLKNLKFKSLDAEDDKFIFRILSTIEFLKNSKLYV